MENITKLITYGGGWENSKMFATAQHLMTVFNNHYIINIWTISRVFAIGSKK